MKNITKITLIILIFVSTVSGQNFISNVSKAGISAAPFLTIGLGPRANSMGGAFVAMADDATALYWNPAGLPLIKENMFIVTHSEWLADISFDFGGIVLNLGAIGNLGASVTTLTMDEMEVRTEDEPEGTGEFFSATDIAFATTYAKSLTDRFSIGFTGKYILQKIWHSQASTFALDFGTLFRTDFLNGLRIGAVVSNFGPDMKMDGRDLRYFVDPDPRVLGNNDRIPSRLETDPWPLPLNFQFGLATDVYEADGNVLTVSADAMHPSDNYEYVNFGVEFVINDMIFLRGGFRGIFLDDNEEGLTLGSGLDLSLAGNTKLKLDYAYQTFGRLSDVQSFAMTILF